MRVEGEQSFSVAESSRCQGNETSVEGHERNLRLFQVCHNHQNHQHNWLKSNHEENEETEWHW